MKILIFGLPGSGKSTLAEPFAKLLTAVWINADEVRKRYNDWDFSPEARMRQAQRMKYLCDGVVNKHDNLSEEVIRNYLYWVAAKR